MLRNTAFCLAFMTMAAASAQDTTGVGWKKSFVAGFTTTQTAYSNSWVGGEAGSVNWVSNLNGFAEKQLSARANFKSTLKLSFGQTITQDEISKDWSKPKKSTDLIDFENVARFTLGGLVDPYAAFRLESQFYDGSFSAKKLYLSPLKLTESAGLARKFYEKDKDFVTSRLGLALRQIFKSTVADSVTLATANSTFTDSGIESVTDAYFTFHQNLLYTGKLSLYKAFYFSESDAVKGTPFKDDWKAVDVNWENIVTAQVTKIVAVNLYTQLLYDREVSRKGRIKETLAIGFVIKVT